MGLEVSVIKKEEGVFVLVPVGEINSDTYTILEDKVKEVMRSETKAIVFDLKDVTYISSMGLGVLFRAKQNRCRYLYCYNKSISKSHDKAARAKLGR